MKIQLDEEKLIKGVDLYREHYGAEPTEMIKCLEKGAIFRKEGLEPFYIFDNESHALLVTSQLNMDNKLN